MNKWNLQLYNEKIKIEVLQERFNRSTPQCIHDAAAVLSFKSFQMFRKTVKRADGYEDSPISDVHVELSCQSYPTAPKRKLYRNSATDFFLCGAFEVACAFEQQCAHSLAANGCKFIESQFHKRHMRRDRDCISFLHLSNNNNCWNDTSNFEEHVDLNLGEDGDDANDTTCIDTEALVDKTTEDEDDKSNSDQSCADEENINLNLGKEGDDDNNTTIDTEALVDKTSKDEKNNDVEALSISEMKKVLNEILGSYGSCSDSTKMRMGSIMLSLRAVELSDGQTGFCY